MTDNVCGRTKRDGSGDSCGLPAGWGTDHPGEGACKLHGGNAGAPEGNNNAVTVAAWAEDFVTDFLRDDEIKRVKEFAEIAGEPKDAQEAAGYAAGLALEQFRRTGDDRFLRRYESIMDTFNLAPGDEMDVNVEQSGDVTLTINREVVDADGGDA